MKNLIIKQLLNTQEIDYVDIGCAFGIQPEFKSIERFVKFHGFDAFSTDNRLDRSNYGNLASIEITETAVWSERGTRPFYVTKKSACSSLLEPNHSLLTALGMDDRFSVVKKLELAVSPLDDHVTRADYLKIDVQGAAQEVLEGGKDLLGNCGLVEIETEFVELYSGQHLVGAIIQTMQERGYRFAGFKDMKYLPGGFARNSYSLAYADALFYNPVELTKAGKKGLEKYLALALLVNSQPIANYVIGELEKLDGGYRKGIRLGILLKYWSFREKLLRRAGINK